MPVVGEVLQMNNTADSLTEGSTTAAGSNDNAFDDITSSVIKLQHVSCLL